MPKKCTDCSNGPSGAKGHARLVPIGVADLGSGNEPVAFFACAACGHHWIRQHAGAQAKWVALKPSSE